MSEKNIIFKHISEDIKYEFIASDEKFVIIGNGVPGIVNAYGFMTGMQWFLDSESYVAVKKEEK